MSTTASVAGDATSDTPTQRCKHCKQQIDKSLIKAHSAPCMRDRKKREREKQEAAAANSKDKDGSASVDGNAAGSITSPTVTDAKSKNKKLSLLDTKDKDADKDSAKGNATNSKKRKAEGPASATLDSATTENTKPPTKKQKKKDEAKAKAPKPKGPVDVEKQCGVLLPNGAMCARSLTCKSHAMGAKRAVPGRSMPYDLLLAQYQKKNQAKQQKAALASTAPLPDDLSLDAPTGHIDSDEEKEAVMLGLSRAAPRPLFMRPIMSTKTKYSHIRMKEMLAGALGGSRGGGLFATASSQARVPAWPGSGTGTGTGVGMVTSSDRPDASGDVDVKRPPIASRRSSMATVGVA